MMARNSSELCFGLNVSNEVFIYLIVALNTLVQLMLIWRLKFPGGGKWKYCLVAVAIPVLVMVSMRLAVAGGMIHGRMAEQSTIERWVTSAASVLLLAGPWLVTLAALVNKRRRALLARVQAEAKEPE